MEDLVNGMKLLTCICIGICGKRYCVDEKFEVIDQEKRKFGTCTKRPILLINKVELFFVNAVKEAL
jgi:hypothetical protein